MSKRCERGFEHQLEELLPEALPRLDEARSRAIRASVVERIATGASVPRWAAAARRSVAAFAATSALLGSVGVAAAVSHPGEPAYPLKEAFAAVREAVSRSAPAEQTKPEKATSVVEPRSSSRSTTQTPGKPADDKSKVTGKGKATDAKGKAKPSGVKQDPTERPDTEQPSRPEPKQRPKATAPYKGKSSAAPSGKGRSSAKTPRAGRNRSVDSAVSRNEASDSITRRWSR